MAFTLADTAIRAALHTSIQTGWSLTDAKIYDTAPFLPKVKTDLPMAVIELQAISPQTGEGAASLRDVQAVHAYRIQGVFVLPSSTNIEAYKVQQAQALLDVLSATKTLGGWLREITGIDFSNDEISQGEPVVLIDITLNVYVITDF